MRSPLILAAQTGLVLLVVAASTYVASRLFVPVWLAVTVVIAIGVWWLRAQGGRWDTEWTFSRLAALFYGIPAGLAIAGLWLASSADGARLSVSLVGVAHSGAGGEATLTVGGDGETHDLWIPQVPTPNEPAASGLRSVAELRLVQEVDANGRPRRFVRVEQPPSGTDAVVTYRLPGSSEVRLVGEQRVEPGEALPGGASLHRHDWWGRIALKRPDGTVRGLPVRWSRVPIPGLEVNVPMLQSASVRQRTHPLADLGNISDLGFLYQRDGLRGLAPLYVWAPPETEAHVEELPCGASLSVEGLPHDWSRTFEAGGIREWREVRLLCGDEESSDPPLVLGLVTPKRQMLTWEQLSAMSAGSEEEDLVRVPIEMGRETSEQASIHFSYISAPVAAAASGRLELTRSALEERGEEGERDFVLETPEGPIAGKFGRPFFLGGSKGVYLLLERVALPAFGLIVFALIMLALKLSVVYALLVGEALRPRMEHPGMLVIAGALEVLVTIRLLLGVEAWLSPPHSEEAYRLALCCWTMVPWVFLLAVMPPLSGSSKRRWGKGHGTWAVAAAGLTLSAAWSWLVASSALKGLAWVALHVLAVGIVLGFEPLSRVLSSPRAEPGAADARAAAGSGYLAAMARRARRQAAKAIELAKRLLRHGVDGVEESGRWHDGVAIPTWTWLLAPLVISLVRLVFVFFGMKEAVHFGVRVGLNVFHVPYGVVVQAFFLAAIWESRRRGRDPGLYTGLRACVLVAFLWLVPALVASDGGIALVNLPVLLAAIGSLAASALWESRRSGRRRGSRRKAAWAVALIVVGLVFVSPLVMRGVGSVWLASAELPLERLDRNDYRLLYFAAPEETASLGVRGTEELDLMFKVLASYNDSGLLGRGYMNTELSPHVSATALREHAASVYVVSQWGLMAGGALVLAYLVLSLEVLHVAPWNAGGRSGVWGTLAALSGLSLGVPSIIMILANFGAVMFTGQNVRLLAMDSTSGALLSVALVFVMAYAWRRPALGRETAGRRS